MTEKKLYRSSDSLLGGICKGIAEYFNIDPIVVQIITVVLTIATAGVLGFVYIVLWIIIPPAPDQNAPVDVRVEEVHSDTYGQVVYGKKMSTESVSAVSNDGSTGSAYVGSAHIPPEPPFASSAAAQSASTQSASTSNAPIPSTQAPIEPPQNAPQQPRDQSQAHLVTQAYTVVSPSEEAQDKTTPPSGEPIYTTHPKQASAQSAPQNQASSQEGHFGAAPPQGAYAGSVPAQNTYANPSATSVSVSPSRSSSVSSGALWVGFVLLFIGISALLGVFVEGAQWWQFWPLILVISGIGHMIVPGKKGHRMARFVNGLTWFSFGVAALPFSLGFFALSSLVPIFVNLWPFLVIMCGFYVLGEAMKAPLITLLGGLCFVAFCFVALGWFATPGPTDMISMTLPNGKSYIYDLNFWSW